MKKTNQQWGGRFEEKMDDFILSFNESVSFDKRLANDDIRGSIAHATMLGEQAILSQTDVTAIIAGLTEIKQEIEAGAFT